MGGPGSGRKKGSGTARSADSKLYVGSSAGSRARVAASLARGKKIKADRIAQSLREKRSK